MVLAAIVVRAGLVQDVRKIEVSKLGPQVGEKVPDFTLADQHGKPWTLNAVIGPRGAMLVFYRSADWCGHTGDPSHTVEMAIRHQNSICAPHL